MVISCYLYRALLFFVVLLCFTEIFIYLTVTRNTTGIIRKRYLRDYEGILCSTPFTRNWTGNTSAPCPTTGIVTAFHHWGLFITMWQYTNILMASLNTGMMPYLPGCMKESLEKIFNEVPMPALSELGHCYLPLPEAAVTLQSWTSPTQSIVLKTADLYNDLAVEYLEVVREHFSFNSVMKNFANSFLTTAKQNRTSVTFVGVYISRTDIIVNQEFDNIFPSPQFFLDAMNQFREKYSDALFITIADRKGFWEDFLGKSDVFLINESSFTQFGSALAVLSHCNHSILAADDFAIWGAILAGGEAIVSISLTEDLYSLMRNRKNWTYLINNTRPGNKMLNKT